MGDMTGDAPQPGETPRDDGTPWSHTDPASPWWRADEHGPDADRSRSPRRRADPTTAAAPAAVGTPTLDPPQPAQHTGAAAEAHQAGAEDVRAALTGETPRGATAVFTVPDHPAAPVEKSPVTEHGLAERKAAEQGLAERQAAKHKTAEQQLTERQATEHKTAEQQPADRQAAEHKIAEQGLAEQKAAVRMPAAPRHAQQQPLQQQPAAERTVAERQPGQEKPTAQPGRSDGKGIENDHDRVDAERFNTAGAGSVYAARNHARPATGPAATSPAEGTGSAATSPAKATGPAAAEVAEREPTIVDLLNAVPAEPPSAADPPDVMVLPEPDRNRPTVALDRNSVPGQPPSGLSRLDRAQQDRARADRALQDRVRQERTAALLETSPFWKAEEERRAHSWPPPGTPEKVAERPSRRRARPPRRPVAGLFGLLALGLVAAFFAWVSAEPFWLAVGHGDRGSAIVARCTGSGVAQRCTGQFTAANGAYRVDRLALYGVEPGLRAPGASAPARMVSSESRQAYVGGTGLLMHLRWSLSFVLVLLCGLGIAGLTGTRRLDPARARRGALLISMVGPLLLLAGFLAVTY